MPNVAFVREEVKKLIPQYYKIRDCIEGEDAIKKAGVKYLPRPNATDVSAENAARYDSYKERAIFYNVTQNTLAGMVGQIFMRDPVWEVPTSLDATVTDANGGGVSLVQLAKRCSYFVVPMGRSGVLSDYPVKEEAVSKAELEAGEIRPTLNVYAPWDIINWRKIVKGAQELFSLVVLQETYVIEDDGFEMKKGTQWRVLQLNDAGFYSVTIWRKGGEAIYQIVKGPYFPTDAKGNLWEEIPFKFVGSENNDDMPDLPPMYSIASINIAHYRNSADYEESCYMVGQPTPYFSGLTEEWVNQVLKGSIALGSRGAVPLPVGGDAGLLQCEPNIMPMEAMLHKEKQMVALGAKLIEQASVQRTATESVLESTAEMSTLSSCAKNISAAIEQGLKWCARFAGVDEESIKFELNTDFDLAKMNAQERAQLIAEWQAGAIAFEEMRSNLRHAGIAKLDDEEAKALIDKELEESVSFDNNAAAEAAGSTAAAIAAAAPPVKPA
jgi:hypothetical protein